MTEIRWLVRGLALAFCVPFIFSGLPRDLYYVVYVVAVFAFFGVWLRATHQHVRELVVRHRRLTAILSVVAGAVLVAIVLGKGATARPHDWSYAGALAWRGVVYGFADGLLLSAFPILAVYAAFGAPPLRGLRAIGIGAAALAASLAFTAVYHAGYSDFRSAKLRQPVAGSVVWSLPTLVTANPLGAPFTHAALHVAAVSHSYETDLFLPPH